MVNEPNIRQTWNALREILEKHFSFHDIKAIVGLAGFDLVSIADIQQKPKGGASIGQLMGSIDSGLREPEKTMERFVVTVSEEVLRRRPELQENIEYYLSRLGWTLVGNALIPIDIFDPADLCELPVESREDIQKAAQRLRDGDLSGAISSACGAVDTATSAIYGSYGLGDPTDASFQERCKRAMKATGIFEKIEEQLGDLNWSEEKTKMLCKNFEGTLNQGACMMQTLRSGMGDVHGTKPVLKPLVFDCLKLAEIMLRALKAN